MSISRERILAAVKASTPEAVTAPQLNFDKLKFENPIERFCEVLSTVGGEALIIESEKDISNHLKIPDDAKVISALNIISDQNIEREKLNSAHDMNDIDFCCFKGDFAVAENAAIHSNCDDFPFRSVYFLAENLVVTLKASEVLNNMHEAYERLIGKDITEFAAFISGPSKTADIEQSLVIGAHGARSLKVFIEKDL